MSENERILRKAVKAIAESEAKPRECCREARAEALVEARNLTCYWCLNGCDVEWRPYGEAYWHAKSQLPEDIRESLCGSIDGVKCDASEIRARAAQEREK